MKQESSMIIIQNQHVRLSLGTDGTVYSLILLESGEELLDQNELLPLCSITEARPFNNEIKLAHPNKEMTFCARRASLDGDCLRIGFDLVLFDAIIKVCEHADYITFELLKFDVPPAAFGILSMDTPPVESMRLLQLPLKRRERFGDWLNVVSDDRASVCVLATSPYELIDSDHTRNATVLLADASRQLRLCGATAALIACPTEQHLLSAIERIEEDFDLPRGVESRRAEELKRSVFWTDILNPTNVDHTIECAKRCGLKNMLIYYPALFKITRGYSLCGNYREEDLNTTYPNGFASVRDMLAKIKAAGITPGFHILHTHIGIDCRYVTPVADHRLHLKQRFTLARPLAPEDTTVYVEEPVHTAPQHPDCRVLQFGGEIIYYTEYSNEPPYRFTGCQRGYYGTNVIPHERGQIGGVLDISEFCATSLYLDQNTSLQDEIAEQLAAVYDLGFEFIYFDGSEGTNPPFNHHVSSAQYRVLKKLKNPPIFCEGAAKTHFGWHWMSGGNAFDIFPAPIFKEKLVEHPFEEAPRMAQDLTVINFGWWKYDHTMMPDMYEYGNALACSWNCPATVMIKDPDVAVQHPRARDIFEVFRRWEDARERGIITEEQKLALRNTDREHILLINEAGDYELCPYTRVVNAAGGDERLTAYVLTRRDRTYAVLFHTKGEGCLHLPLPADTLLYEEELGGSTIALQEAEGGTRLPIGDRRYLSTKEDIEVLIRALGSATVSD